MALNSTIQQAMSQFQAESGERRVLTLGSFELSCYLGKGVKLRYDNKIKYFGFPETECDYVQTNIFPYLIPALEETLTKAEIWDVLRIQRCFFNGIDYIAELLWNNNPRHPERKLNNLHLFNMPWVRERLKKNPRPYYPKSWLWPEEYAATLIQKTVRQYFVQRDEEVQEMREFWKKLDIEKTHPEMDSNPLLAKKFASQHAIFK